MEKYLKLKNILQSGKILEIEKLVKTTKFPKIKEC